MRGGATRFQPNHTPWNKDTKGKGVMKANSGSFLRGEPSGRAEPIGTIRTRHFNRDGRDRAFIKLQSGWLEYPKYLWIEQYGFLVPGDIVHHLDGDSMNDLNDNLIALTRSMHVRIHNRWAIKEPTDEMWRYAAYTYGMELPERG